MYYPYMKKSVVFHLNNLEIPSLKDSVYQV